MMLWATLLLMLGVTYPPVHTAAPIRCAPVAVVATAAPVAVMAPAAAAPGPAPQHDYRSEALAIVAEIKASSDPSSTILLTGAEWWENTLREAAESVVASGTP